MGLRFLALACLVGAALAGPVQRQSESQCAKQCHPPQNPKLRFQPGKAYVYQFHSQNNILYAGSEKQEANLQGTVEFHLQTHCEGTLKLKNIRIEQRLPSDEKEDLRKKLELPLQYVYVDGKFENVCSSPEESTHSLNIKKAMISSLVNELPSLEKSAKIVERDSLGKCLTNYTVQHNGQIMILKEKDLRTCSNKKIFLNFIEKKLPSIPLIEKSSLKCKQHIESGIIKSVDCEENQQLKPPMGESKGVLKFSGKISLNWVQTKPAEKQLQEYPHHHEEIYYSIEEPRQGDSNVKEVERVLGNMCSKNKLAIDMTVGKDYIHLVSLVKSLSYPQLNKIYENLKDGSVCDSKKVRDIFADTLPVVKTDPAIKLMVKILLNDDATGLKAKVWPASWVLKQNPTEDTINAIVPLLERDSQSTSTLIGVTTLVHRLCTSEDCEELEAVKKVVRVYHQKLGLQCSSDNEHEILTALRAFGNMGHHGEAHETIVTCAKDSSKPRRIRLAAIDSFRRMHTARPREFVQIYSNKREHQEIRIAALRSILHYSDEKQLRQIKRVAESETNEQVSGYVYTYIENMNKTHSTRNRKLKSLLHNIEINPPKVDYFTNSKHLEFSILNEALDVGASVETDIIHEQRTKLPTSLRHRLDATLFGKELNVYEFGIRSEGLEDLVQKLVAMKDKYEEIRDRLAEEPTYEEIKKEFSDFSPSKIFGVTRAEVSMYFRTLETEIFDLSTSDLSGVKEMLRIAELMSRLARGKKADFSHSVVLMNSKLVVPSITGRSYSVGVVGSSTVGVTAETKADILKLPRNADLHLKFQPSVNLEFSTTVGIQSNTQRPDIKAVTRVHFESDMDARFQVKDGHVALAKLSFPSENIALAKMSTNVYKIDEENNEKRVFEKMQKKVDYCVEHLHKPLGISACATLLLSKPFMTPYFPYVVPFGDGEVALKKSDKSFKEYQFLIEIPKQASPRMRYTASFDTPGSTVSRRFAAELEVKQERDRKDLSLELVSPFKAAGASCSFTKNEKHIKASAELHTNDTQIAQARVFGHILQSKSRKTCQFEGEYSLQRKFPKRIEGQVTIIKGRKQHITIDVKTNTSQSEPIALRATIMKEGNLGLSQKSEWKLSSEVSVKGPLGDAKIRNTVEKRSKQSQSISANLGLDYQLKGQRKHSFSMSSTSQRSSNKVNTNVKLQSTQYPKANLHLTWDLQRESESFTNEIKVTDGQKPHKTYVIVKQKSRMSKTGPGYCSATLEIPQRNIHYEVTVHHDIDLKEKRRINLEADLCYKQDKHIKGSVDVKYESLSPLKASGKLELDLPGGHYIYEDEIEEIDDVIKGHSKLQYRKGKVIQIQYKYKKSSNDTKLHHEIESSIQTPSSRSPINSKASVELSSESLAIVGQVGPRYSVQAHVKKNGVSNINIQTPMIEGTMKSTDEDKKKTVDVDVKVKTQRPRRIIGSLVAESGDKRKLELRVQPDVDRAPEKKILLSTTIEKTSNTRDQKGSFVSASRIEFLDIIKLSIAEEGDISPLGDYECTVETSIKSKEPMLFKFKRQTGKEHGKISCAVSKNNIKKAQLELDTKLNEREFSIGASLISPDHSFEDVHMQLKNQVTRSGSSKTYQTSLSFKNKDKNYRAEWNSDIQPNGLEVNAQMETPHKNYEKNALGFSIQVTDNMVSSSVSLDCLDNKKISIQTEFKTKNHACSFVGKIRTPFEIAKEAQLQVTVDNHHSKKSVEALIDINEARICDIRANMKKSPREHEIEGSFKVSNLPKVKIQGLDIKVQTSSSHALVSGSVQLMNSKEISMVSEIKKEGDVMSTTTTITTPYKPLKNAKAHLSIENQSNKRSLLCYLDANGERKGDIEFSIVSSKDIEVKGRMKTIRTPEISAHVKCGRTGKSFSFSANVMKGTSPLLSTSFNKLSYHGGEKLLVKTTRFEDTLIYLEISKDTSDENADKFSLKADGPFSPISVSFWKNYNDKNAVSTELRACKKVQSSETCYNVKSYHKNLIHSENYRFYQKVTIDVEKSVGGSYSKPLGRLQVLMTAAEHDYRSKVTLEVNEKKLGYEGKLHLRQHENDKCSLDSYIYLPQRTSRVRISVHHNHHDLKLEADAIPNTDEPTRKLGLEISKLINPDNKEVSGYLKVNHPRMPRPIYASCKLQLEGEHFVKGKIVLHNPLWGKTLMVEALPNLEQEAYGIRSMLYKVYTDDKSIDAWLKLVRQSSKTEEMIGYEYTISAHDGEKKGGLTAILSRKPKTLKIRYSSPSADYEVAGSVSQGPNDVTVSVASNGRKLREISFSVSESCANILVTKSGPLIRSQLCVNKQEGNKLHLLKIDVQYRQHKCLDVQVSVDPEKPEYIDAVFRCNKEESCRALKEIVHVESLLQGHSLQELKQKLVREVRHIKHDVLEPRVMKLRKSLRDLKDDLSSKMKNKIDQHEKVVMESIRKFKETKKLILNNIKSLIPVSLTDAFSRYYQHYHELAMKYYQKVIRQVCSHHTYCSDIKSAIRHFDAKETRMQFDRKINEIKQSWKSMLPTFRIIWPSDVISFIKEGIIKLKDRFIHAFRQEFLKFSEKIQNVVREWTLNLVDVVIKRFNNLFSTNEDLRTAKQLILNAKDEIMKAWRRKEEIAESSAKRIETNFKQNLKKIVDHEVPDFEYDREKGYLRVKVRQPLTKDEIDSVTHGFQLILRKVLEYLRL